MIILLALLFGVEAECPADMTRAEFRATLEVAHTDFSVEKDVDVATISHQLSCLKYILTPEDAVWMHGLRSREMARIGDVNQVLLSTLAARTIALPGAPPEWLEKINVPMPVPAPWLPFSSPQGIALFVDGAPAQARPVDRPAIYQAMGPGGIVLWTKYLGGDEDLPPGFILQAPAPPVSTLAMESAAEDMIHRVKNYLLDGDFETALSVSGELAAQYPERAETFRSLAAIAADQMQRTRELQTDQAHYLRRAQDKSTRWPYRKDERRGVLVGFEVGTLSSVRLDWKIAGKIVDSIGIRIGYGMHLMSFSTLNGAFVTDPIVIDFNMARQWQLETSLGVIASSSLMPTFGLGVQWDPDSPIQISAGAAIDGYGIAPRATVGFMW